MKSRIHELVPEVLEFVRANFVTAQKSAIEANCFSKLGAASANRAPRPIPQLSRGIGLEDRLSIAILAAENQASQVQWAVLLLFVRAVVAVLVLCVGGAMKGLIEVVWCDLGDP